QLEPKYEPTDLPLSTLGDNKMELKEEDFKEEDTLNSNAVSHIFDLLTLADDPNENQGRQTYSNEDHDSLGSDMIEREGENQEEFGKENVWKTRRSRNLDSMADDSIDNEEIEKETFDGVPD
ncbi:hypothetical protein PMAYCL1PPCAC_13981, partial [Pristionchus mayeri]